MKGWIRDVEANRDVRAEMCERGRILTQGLQGSAQGFAGASGDVASGDAFLTRGLQGSTQCFVGARGCGERGCFLLKLLD
jgi:hypothetical protein